MSLETLIDTLDFDWSLHRMGRLYFARDTVGVRSKSKTTPHAALRELADKVRLRRDVLRNKTYGIPERPIRLTARRVARRPFFKKPLGRHC